MKILLASSSSGSRGGGELWLRYLGVGLRDLGHTVGLWVSSDPIMDELAQAFTSIGEVIRSPYTNTYKHLGRSLYTLFNFSDSQAVESVWKSWNPDILHINKQNLEDGLDLLRAANACPFPSVCTVHITQSAQMLKALMPQLRDWIAKSSLRQYLGEFVTAPQTRADSLNQFIGKNNLANVILNAVPEPDKSMFPVWRKQKRLELGIQQQEILFTAVGRMVAQKKPMYFLELASKIKKTLTAARFLWIGDGNLSQKWDEFVQEKYMDSYVQRLPWQHEVTPWLAASDLYLHVAEFEGMPFSVIEALSTGLPCLLTKKLLTEIPPFQADGILCLDQPEQWINKIKFHQTREELGQAALNLYQQKFSLRRMAEEYTDVYQKALTTNKNFIHV